MHRASGAVPFGPRRCLGPKWIVRGVIEECPLTEDCPGFDRDLRACLIRPGDCEFNPAETDADLRFETSEAQPHPLRDGGQIDVVIRHDLR